MNFSFDIQLSALTVFLQGFLSFFSPCILPLIPLYMSYLAGGSKTIQPDGSISYHKKEVFLHTAFFVLGISTTFFILGFSVTTLGQFLSGNRSLFASMSGFLMVIFGLYQLGFLGHSSILEREHRFSFSMQGRTMNPLNAFLFGFTFSFAWTPCVGPTLGSVLLMAGSSDSASKGFFFILLFTFGFILPFLAVGLSTTQVLQFFKEKQQYMKYSVKLGAILMIIMGVTTATGVMNEVSGYFASFGTNIEYTQETTEQESSEPNEPSNTEQNTEQTPLSPAVDFELFDQYNQLHSLSEYKGKTIFLNFWATWCPPCEAEMPDIQAIYEAYGYNQEDVIILGVTAPNLGQEKDIAYITSYLEEHQYSFPVLMNESFHLFQAYQIMAFPTTFMIDTNGAIYGYVSSMLTKDIMIDIIEQTKNSTE